MIREATTKDILVKIEKKGGASSYNDPEIKA
jgi:hypothetical protein